MDFNKEKDELLKGILELKINKELESKFFSFVEGIIVDMMENDDNFFGSFMIQVKRDISTTITWPLATVPTNNGFKMYFNPKLFLDNSKNEMKAMIKHEIYHIMYNHYEREKSLRDRYSKIAVNIALDISINQFIKSLPAEYKRLHSVNLEYGLELKDNMPCEYYAEELNKFFKTLEKEIVIDFSTKCDINIETAHDSWWKESISQEILDNIAKNAAQNAYKGKAPKDIESIIFSYEKKSEISWQKMLKSLILSLRAGTKKTITRRNRRQPERMDLKGNLTNSVPEIIIAIDISASMTDDEIKNIMVEILDIVKMRENKITVIECDNEIRRIYGMKSTKDIKERKSNNGATAFTPVFKYIKENNMRNIILIYFTDGAGEKELGVQAINKSTIWVLTGEEEISLINAKGTVKRIKNVKEKGEGGATALDMVRNSIHEWPR